MYLMSEPTTKLEMFYLSLREKLKNNGVVHVKLANIPFSLTNNRMGDRKKMIAADFGNKFDIRTNSRAGTLVVNTTSGTPAPSKKPAYVNNSSR